MSSHNRSPGQRQAHQDNDDSPAPAASPSDENYDGNNESSPSPPSSSSSPLILYSPPTIWGLLRGAAINLLLPFINGLMLGLGELLAHEAAFRFGWSQTRVFPESRKAHPIGPGVEMRERPETTNTTRQKTQRELD